MYFTIQNTGPIADTLTGVHVAGVANAELHMEVMSGMSHAMPSMTMATMVPTPAVPIPPHGALHLAPGGRHVMLMGLQRHFMRGDSTSADLTFTHTGTVHIPVRVIDYTQLDTLVSANAPAPSRDNP
jgi:hypothetical protein